MMRVLKFVAALVALALLSVAGPASAGGGYCGGGGYRGGYHHHPHVSIGVWGPGWWGGWGGYWGPRYWPGYWGAGYWGPGYWGAGYPYTWPSAAVVVPQEPRVYVERDEVAAPLPGPTPSQWWYWCASAKAYYPYVSTCSEGWQRVPPQPVRTP